MSEPYSDEELANIRVGWGNGWDFTERGRGRLWATFDALTADLQAARQQVAQLTEASRDLLEAFGTATEQLVEAVAALLDGEQEAGER